MTLKQCSLQFGVKVNNCLYIYICFAHNDYNNETLNQNKSFVENNYVFGNGELPGCIGKKIYKPLRKSIMSP